MFPTITNCFPVLSRLRGLSFRTLLTTSSKSRIVQQRQKIKASVQVPPPLTQVSSEVLCPICTQSLDDVHETDFNLTVCLVPLEILNGSKITLLLQPKWRVEWMEESVDTTVFVPCCVSCCVAHGPNYSAALFTEIPVSEIWMGKYSPGGRMVAAIAQISRKTVKIGSLKEILPG